MSPQNLINQKILLGEDYILIWVEAFLKAKKSERITKGTILFYKIRLKGFTDFLEALEVKYISQITPSLIRDFLLILEERGHNSGGVHSYYTVVKIFLRWYWEEEEPEGKNPIDKVKAPKNPILSIEGISKDDFNSLLDECKSGFVGERDKAILFTLYDTGVRATELCNIKLENLNLVDSSILIEQGKGRKPRYVFFGKSTKRQLKKYLTIRGVEGSYLFTLRSRERIDYQSLRGIVRRLSMKANLEGIGLHDFRRAFCLNLLNSGVPEITIARLMGHTTTVLIGRYAKQKKEDLELGYKSPIDKE
jgi:site-specific recombinase XerD